MGRAFGVLPKFAAASLGGEIGVGMMHAVAKVVAQNLNGYKLVVQKSTAPVVSPISSVKLVATTISLGVAMLANCGCISERW